MPEGPVPEPISRLYLEHFDRLVHVAGRIVGQSAVAEDLVHEAFVRLLERPPADLSRVEGWMTVVLRRLCYDYLRRESQAKPGAPESMAAPSAEAEWMVRENRQEVESYLMKLNERDRTALWLRHSGYSYRDIAGRIGVKEGAVGVILLRAMEKLRHVAEVTPERNSPLTTVETRSNGGVADVQFS